MDNAVLAAYGWTDLNLAHDFYEVDYLPENDRIRFTISPAARREVLKRLLKLNHEIHEQEVKAGLWDKKGRKGKKKITGVKEKAVSYKPGSEETENIQPGLWGADTPGEEKKKENPHEVRRQLKKS